MTELHDKAFGDHSVSGFVISLVLMRIPLAIIINHALPQNFYIGTGG